MHLPGRSCLVFAALIGSRLAIFFAPPAAYRLDLGPYPFWAREYHLAVQAGEDFYTFHERRARADIERGRAAGPYAGEESTSFEYPPLSLALIVLPSLPFDLAEGPVRLPASHPYVTSFRLTLLLLDLATFGIVVLLIKRLYPEESAAVRTERLLVYIGATTVLGLLIYTRLDIALAALLAAALCLLVSSRNYSWAFLFLALAVNFKLVPLIFLPVFVLGSLPADWPRPGLSLVQSALPLAGRTALALGLIVLVFLPFFLIGGERAYGFLAYHRERGLEVESVYAGLLMVLDPTSRVDVGYGSYNLTSAWAPTVARLGTVLLAVLLAFVALRLLLAVLKRPRQGAGGPSATTLAQAQPRLFAGYALLLALVLLCASKVLSPQYLLWVIPLAVVAPLPPSSRRAWLFAFLALCALTTAVFPLTFWKHVAGIAPGSDISTAPDFLGVLLVNARNALLVGLTIWTACLMRRAPGTGASVDAGPGVTPSAGVQSG